MTNDVSMRCGKALCNNSHHEWVVWSHRALILCVILPRCAALPLCDKSHHEPVVWRHVTHDAKPYLSSMCYLTSMRHFTSVWQVTSQHMTSQHMTSQHMTSTVLTQCVECDSDVTHSWRDSFMCVMSFVMSLIHVRDVTHSWASHDSFMSVTWLISGAFYILQPVMTHKWVMSHYSLMSHVSRHDSWMSHVSRVNGM